MTTTNPTYPNQPPPNGDDPARSRLSELVMELMGADFARRMLTDIWGSLPADARVKAAEDILARAKDRIVQHLSSDYGLRHDDLGIRQYVWERVRQMAEAHLEAHKGDIEKKVAETIHAHLEGHLSKKLLESVRVRIQIDGMERFR